MSLQEAVQVVMTEAYTIGENVSAVQVGNMLIVAVDTNAEGRPSASGKTLVVGTTHGATRVGRVNVNVNVYTR